MNKNDIISQAEQSLTAEIKSLIVSEGHVKSGKLLRDTSVKITATNTGYKFSISSTDYFDDVEEDRIMMGKPKLTTLLFGSVAFDNIKKLIFKGEVEQIKKDLINDLKNNKI